MPSLLNCSACGAPLDLTSKRSTTVRCHYCFNTTVLPDELHGSGDEGRTVKHSIGSVIDRSIKLAEVARLAQSGNKIAAIKLYRETFGGGLKEAKEAVEKIERGEPFTLDDAYVQSESVSIKSPLTFDDASAQAVRHISKAILWIVVSVVVAIVIIIVVVVLKQTSSRPKPPQVNIIAPPGFPAPPIGSSPATAPAADAFANSALEFGSEGIGASQFKDHRSVAVDGEGRIYVGEYTGGRVQVFDGQGNFITQWMVDSKRALLNLAADRKGTVYIVHPGRILRYEGLTGNLIGEVPALQGRINQFYSDVFVALDGSLYAIGSNSNVLRIDASGNIKTIVDVRERLGEDVGLDKVAVDGAGNIYALTEHECTVLKFSPDGRFITRFGGRGDQPGQLRAPQNVAVDGQGRVYVSDMMRAINVFDGDGRYLTYFAGSDVVFGMAINDKNEIFACHRNRHKIIKYQLKGQ